jgi:hypothetical protein
MQAIGTEVERTGEWMRATAMEVEKTPGGKTLASRMRVSRTQVRRRMLAPTAGA